MQPDLFNQITLELHRLGRTEFMADFQKSALESLRRGVAFDAAWWGIGTRQADGSEDVQTSTLYRLDSQLPRIWSEIQSDDVLARVTAERPGVTVNLDVDTAGLSARMRALSSQFQISHCLSTCMPFNEVRQVSFVSLYRSDAKRPFSEDERVHVQYFMPHLTSALTTNWILHIERIRPRRNGEQTSLAFVDKRGFLHVGDRHLMDLFRAEWPDWNGPHMPPNLLKHKDSGTNYHGRTLQARFHPMGDLWLVDLRSNIANGNLTAREEQIAASYAEGISYKSLAKNLGLAPSTVRGHLREIYRKLQVSGKAELAQKLVSHAQPDMSLTEKPSAEDLRILFRK